MLQVPGPEVVGHSGTLDIMTGTCLVLVQVPEQDVVGHDGTLEIYVGYLWFLVISQET